MVFRAWSTFFACYQQRPLERMEKQPLPTLSRILIYPVKSLDGIAVNRATVLASGALKGDREFALVDAEGQFINGKRYAAIHSIRAKFDLEARSVRRGYDSGWAMSHTQ
ncbi:MAG TPA: MOSC N-terminal beta barrel domain-containing protein, partial [Coleofasciculaceae cyanobacterium]